MEKKTLYLIDAMALIYRSYYALNKNPRINSKGFNTSAILGFANSLLDIIKQHKPSSIGVAFDLHGKTLREEEYEDYKANRQETPEDIIASVPYVMELLKALNIPILAKEGYEADDIIGTLSKKAEEKGYLTFMVTPDKDYAQLVSDSIFMLKLPRMGNKEEIWGVKEVLERFEIKNPKQVIDILGLWGDSSDNIPGVPSIGEKKAKQLMQQFSSIEDILANSDKIESPSIRRAIEENKEKALLSKRLATIVLDVPIDFDEQVLELKAPNLELCKEIFSFLEFKSFEKRFLLQYSSMGLLNEKDINLQNEKKKEGNSNLQPDLFGEVVDNGDDLFTFSSKKDNIETVKCNYRIAKKQDDVKELISLIKKTKKVSINLTYIKSKIGSIVPCIALCYEKNNGICITFTNYGVEKEFFSSIKEVFEDEEIEKIAHDIKHVKGIFRNRYIEIKGKMFDTMVAHYLLDAEARHSLDFISSNFLNYELMDEDATFRKYRRGDGFSWDIEDSEELMNFSLERADMAFQLKDIFYKKLIEDEMIHLFQEVEMPLVDVLLDMEWAGVNIDVKQLEIFSANLQKQKEVLEEEIYSLAGERFNISSPKQLGDILFKKLQITKNAKTTSLSKQFSTAEEVLIKLKASHPIVEKILEYRSITKLKSTYVDSLPKMRDDITGFIHTNYNQTITATGRLSSTNPNLQNIPIRTEQGKNIRKAFIAKKNNILFSCDYSQIELRIIASLSGDEHLCKAFNEGMDIHLATAQKIYNVPLNEVTPQMRSFAKSVNFGIIYGISAFGLSEQLSISRKEAQDLIDEYFCQYPQVKNFIEESISIAKERGYAKTLLNRRRYLYEINSKNANLRNFAQRNAVNMPIQGTSADMIKKAMVNIYNRFYEERLKSKMIMQVHDELVFDVYIPEKKIVKKIVEEEMKNALPLKNVPIEVSSKFGKNWLEAH
ncbi:MAG: DNA polymerase I [Bacteroidales bacterium]|jgi:DNA polymerase-1|nr:DNA polymerase I [Bacteroidales bacterium]